MSENETIKNKHFCAWSKFLLCRLHVNGQATSIKLPLFFAKYNLESLIALKFITQLECLQARKKPKNLFIRKRKSAPLPMQAFSTPQGSRAYRSKFLHPKFINSESKSPRYSQKIFCFVLDVSLL